MAPNHIVVINRRGSYQDISGLILFTPGRPNKPLFAEFAQLWCTPETSTAPSDRFGSRKCLWICFHAAFEICRALQHLRGQHALYPCINTNRTQPLNIVLLKMTRVVFATSDMCHGQGEAAVIGFSSRVAGQTPPLPRLFTLSTVQIAAAPAHISLRCG